MELRDDSPDPQRLRIAPRSNCRDEPLRVRLQSCARFRLNLLLAAGLRRKLSEGLPIVLSESPHVPEAGTAGDALDGGVGTAAGQLAPHAIQAGREQVARG